MAAPRPQEGSACTQAPVLREAGWQIWGQKQRIKLVFVASARLEQCGGTGQEPPPALTLSPSPLPSAGGKSGATAWHFKIGVNLSSVLSRPQPGVLFATASHVLIFYTSPSASPTLDPTQFWQREPSTGGKDQTQQLNHQKKNKPKNPHST